VQVYIEWRDLWWPLFIGRDAVYLCLLPTVVLRFATRVEEPDPLDYAMWTVYIDSGKWRWTTQKMTTDAREAAVAAVLRYDRWMKAQEPDLTLLTRESLAWWD
jgi:hypothetical protein